MKTFWLFRTNLRQYEDYHSIDNLDEFKNKCYDYYLLMGIWLLENTTVDEFVVWRQRIGGHNDHDIIFNIGKKKFIQKFANFNDCFNYNNPDITLFRGGFSEYDNLTRHDPDFFGLKLYLGAGQRVYPQYRGKYDKILVEDERDLRLNKNGDIFFYKTANPVIFYPINCSKEWDICWPCNFTQKKYKGQEWFIRKISESKFLQSLKIVHVGNNPDMGYDICKQFGVKNIEFRGLVNRIELNFYYNKSRMGLVTSNLFDGCPRTITEMLSTGIGLLIRDKTRKPIIYSNTAYIDDLISEKQYVDKVNRLTCVLDEIDNYINFNFVCRKNAELWGIL